MVKTLTKSQFEQLRGLPADIRQRRRCEECGVLLPTGSRAKRCAGCAEKRKKELNRAYQQKMRKERKAEREKKPPRCAGCGHPLPQGRRGGLCDVCTKRRRQELRNYRLTREKSVRHGKDLRQVVRALEAENARRRAEGKPTLTYGQYVAYYNI